VNSPDNRFLAVPLDISISTCDVSYGVDLRRLAARSTRWHHHLLAPTIAATISYIIEPVCPQMAQTQGFPPETWKLNDFASTKGWLVFNGTRSIKRLYCAMRKLSLLKIFISDRKFKSMCLAVLVKM